MAGPRLASALVLAGVLLTGGTAFGQPFVQVGSSGEDEGARDAWLLGGGYTLDAPLMPFDLGVRAQTTVSGSPHPIRAFVTGTVGMLPMPGFGVYLGGGGGVSAWLGGEEDAETAFAAIAVAGLEVGRLHLEAQYQRDFREAPLTRWATVIGLTF